MISRSEVSTNSVLSWQDDNRHAEHLLREIAKMSPDTIGVSRPAYSEVETKTLRYLEDFAREHGLSVTYDGAQNAVFALPEHADAERFILIGSHVDTVPNGGNYDGLAGVIAGLLCLLHAQRTGKAFRKAVKVIALRAEESAWFGPCYISSKALLGQLKDDELSSFHKGDGRDLASHMRDVGINMNLVRKRLPILDPADVEAYIELHIEQGPLLVEKNIPAAVVSGIRGNLRHKKITCVGEAGHSGAVPRAYRKDPVLAFADLLSRLDESWITILQKGEDLVMTSGIVMTDPKQHALTRIPDSIDFSIDFRSQSAEALSETRDLLHREIRAIERERRVKFVLDKELFTAPALCEPKLVDGLSTAMKAIGQKEFVMPSGGGHDAAVFANAGVPSAMVFVRNRNGSHNPDEAMESEDLIVGSGIIFKYLTDLVQ